MISKTKIRAGYIGIKTTVQIVGITKISGNIFTFGAVMN